MENDPAKYALLSDHESFISPCCQSRLRTTSRGWACQQCGTFYLRAGDIAVFTVFRNSTHGELTREEARQLRVEMARHGWQQALATHIRADRPIVETLIADPRRARSVAPLADRPGRVLDFGCGYGGVSIQLRRQGHEVVALDGSIERLSILEEIAQQERLDGLTLVCHQDALNLPFSDDSFDAVVLIGVFEYLPTSIPDQTAEAAHLACLKEFLRVLRPGGRLWVLTKNRFGWQFLQGWVDHSGVRFGSLLPVWLADRLSRLQGRGPYRIVNYSYGEYRSLFERAGFGDIDIYWPLPGYQRPDALVKFADRAAVGAAIAAQPYGRLKHGSIATLHRLGLLRYVVPHFGVLGVKPT